MVSREFFAPHSTSFRFRIRESHGSCDWLIWRRILSLNGLDGSASCRISDAYSWNHFAAKSSSTFQPLWCTYQMRRRDIFPPCDMALPMSISPDRWYPVSTHFACVLQTNHNISTTTSWQLHVPDRCYRSLSSMSVLLRLLGLVDESQNLHKTWRSERAGTS